jgi:hypothetical protein
MNPRPPIVITLLECAGRKFVIALALAVALVALAHTCGCNVGGDPFTARAELAELAGDAGDDAQGLIPNPPTPDAGEVLEDAGEPARDAGGGLLEDAGLNPTPPTPDAGDDAGDPSTWQCAASPECPACAGAPVAFACCHAHACGCVFMGEECVP